MHPPVFDDIHSILQDNFDEEYDFNVEKEDRCDAFFINVADESNDVVVKVTFADETKEWNPLEIEKIQKLSDISYCISAEYITEGIDPGYFRNGTIDKDLDLVCYDIYEKVLDLRKEMIEDREENIKRTKELFENAEPAPPEQQFETQIMAKSSSEEEYFLLSGILNKTTLN